MLAEVQLALVDHSIPEIELRADRRLVRDSPHELLSVPEHLFAVSDRLETVRVESFLEVLEGGADVLDKG